MEVLAPILGSVVQLGLVGLIVWGVVRMVGRRRDVGGVEVDRAASVRRVITYALMYLTLVLGAAGATMVGSAVLDSDWSDRDRSAFALGLAFLLVAGPAYLIILRFAGSRLRADPDERASFSWSAYMNVALATSLIVSIVALHQFLQGAFGIDELEWRDVAPVLVWGAVWSAHWFWLRPAHGVEGDLHLAVGSLAGLVTALIGVGGLAWLVSDEIYTAAVDRPPVDHRSPELGTWLIAAGIGATVWAWHWLRVYRRAERTLLWHVYVVLIAALGGLTVAVWAGATIAYWTIVWYVGDPGTGPAGEHFQDLPAAAGFLVAGTAAFSYHRAALGSRDLTVRSEPIRAYDYLMAAAGLVATVVGATVALASLLEVIAARILAAPSEVANSLILASVLGAIGAPLWSVTWTRIRGHRDADPPSEVGSLTRRLYLVVLFGAGGLVALGALIVVLFIGIEDLLAGTFGGDTLLSGRVALALLASVTGVAGYHLVVHRRDRKAAEALEPSSGPTPSPTHVVLIAPRDAVLAGALAAGAGATVEAWVRDDDMPMPAIDLDDLIARIAEVAGPEVAVVVGPRGADVIPYVT